MDRSSPPAGRQRPGGAFGPVRDEARDARIIDAVLDLIVENGYADVTMAAVAARANVAKATVYRRWATREDLVADAVDSLVLPDLPTTDPRGADSLRDDLVATLTSSSMCLHPQRHRFSVALAAASAAHPQMADTLRERYVDGQRRAVAACLRRAHERGELGSASVQHLTAPGALETAAAVGLLMQAEDLLGAALDVEVVGRVVDQVLMPLIAVVDAKDA